MSEKGLDKVVTFIRFLEKNADNNFLHRVNKKLNEELAKNTDLRLIRRMKLENLEFNSNNSIQLLEKQQQEYDKEQKDLQKEIKDLKEFTIQQINEANRKTVAALQQLEDSRRDYNQLYEHIIKYGE